MTLLLRGVGKKATAPAWNRYFIHLRNTAGGSGGAWSDGPNATYALPADRYVSGTPTRGGIEFGNAASPVGYDANVSSPHYSGNHAMTADGHRQTVKLKDGPGTYRLWAAYGSTAAALTIGGGILNNGATILTVSNQALAQNGFMDLAGTVYANAAAHWAADVPFEHVFSDPVITFLRGQSGARGDLAWYSFQRIA